VTIELLANVLDAHGGLAHWDSASSITVQVELGGPFWAMRGWPDAGLKLTLSLDARREHTLIAPFPGLKQIAVFDVDPERLVIQSIDGAVIEERYDPRSSFPPFDLATTNWDPMQIGYFCSVASWNYFTQPFSLTYPGVEVREIEPWHEADETWRRLAVTFPPNNANHSSDQILYYDISFMQRRADYTVEVAGDAPIAHYTHDPKTFDGFVFPTRRRAYVRDPDGIADQRLAVITLDIASVRVQFR
jgi:hypothetical protein